MDYILQRGREYCCLDGRDKIYKTQDVDSAVRFTDIKKAYDLLHMARKKLKGFRVVALGAEMAEADEEPPKRKTFSESERVAVYNRYKGRCGICGKFVPYDTFTVDHIVPLEKGGTNAVENLQCAHSWCNYVKKDASVEELTGKLAAIVLYQVKAQVGDSIWRRLKDLKFRAHYIYRRNRYRKGSTVMQRAKGDVIDYSTGAKKCVMPTQEEIERSDSLRDEAWEGIEGMLKKELSEEAMMELKAAFYMASQKYLFTGRRG